MTETQERFLREVLARVDAARVAECHLFPPIRRGTVETGVAVLALLAESPPPVVALVPDDVAPIEAATPAEVIEIEAAPSEYDLAPDLGIPVDGDALAIAAAREEAPDMDAPIDGDMLTIAAAEGTAPDVDSPVDGDALTIAAATHAETIAAEATDAVEGEEPAVEGEEPAVEGEEPAVVEVAAEAAPEAEVAAEATPVEVEDIGTLMEDSPYAPEPAPVAAEAVEPVAEPRALIVTARYRSVIKGPDRGQWKLEVQEQGEAPMSAVEAVLRGVRQRSTEPADPESVPLALLAQLLAPAAMPAPIAAPTTALAQPAVAVPVTGAVAA